jgi:beta-mannosidase
MKHLSLDMATWTMRAVGDLSAVPAALRGRDVPAQVPGCVHTDLIRAGLIPDPLVGMNERQVQWIGETDFEYRAAFDTDAELLEHERIDLVCEGLDTIARVCVNGTEVGHAANMFHPHRFNLRTLVRTGVNELSITFRSPLKHIRAEEQRLGKRPVNGDWDPYIFIRKAACNFGWDWAPKLAGCGIWKSVRIHAWSGARLADVALLTRRLLGDRWEVEARASLEWAGASSSLECVEVSGSLQGRHRLESSAIATVQHGGSEVTLTLPVERAALWWPRCMSSNSMMYGLSVAVGQHGQPHDVLNEWHRRVGLREVRLRTPRDEHGAAFELEVNGSNVFCKGANWIPDGPFPIGPPEPFVDDEPARRRLAGRLQQAAAANMNMLRVWGGGHYESDAFYEICDELGIMVWQDFMFACAMYPEEKPYPALIEAEARHQISRLTAHPSVVLWCGGNECAWAHDAWGNAPGERPWKERLASKTWGEGYYFDLLPRLVKELDPTRPYWPNSPYPGVRDLAPNSADHGDRHTWDLRGDGYRRIVPRFCGEFGQQSPSNYATLARVLGPDDLKVGSPAFEHRQRATGGTARHIDEAIAETFRAPRDFDEWHYLAQLTQARAIKTGIEWLRVNRPRCTGALVWQLNDCWPGMSWSLIDSDGREKLAYHAAKEAFRNRLITIQPFDGRPWLSVVNDDDKPARYLIQARRMSFEGLVLGEATLPAECGPGSVARIADLADMLGPALDPTREFIVADAPGHRATWFFLPDRELLFPEPRLSIRRGPANGLAVTYRVEAQSFVRDACQIADRSPAPALYRPVLRTLLPGEAIPFEHHVEAEPRTQMGPIPDEQWIRPPALWCANYFGAASSK